MQNKLQSKADMLTIDEIQKFCSINDIRTYLNKPIRQGGFIYATNGFIAVRVVDDGSFDIPESNIIYGLINFNRVFAERAFAELKPLSALMTGSQPEKSPCKACCDGGKNESARECNECDGDGQFHHGSHTYECRECGGSGKKANAASIPIVCSVCRGCGDGNFNFQVGNQKYNGRLLKLIEDLPNVKIECEVENFDTAKFVFDGGEGRLMPCRGWVD